MKKSTKSKTGIIGFCFLCVALFYTNVAAFNPQLEWSWTSSSVEPNALNVMMTPVVIDLNNDTIPEIVFGSTASTGGALVEIGYLRAIDGQSGTELFTVNDPNFTINTASSIAAGDIDIDGMPEIIACDSTGARLIAFEHDGSFKWRSPYLEGINWGAPAIADINKDGIPEIIIGRQVLDNIGNILWTGTGGKGSQGSVGPLSLVSDIDLDGNPEIVAGYTVYDAAGGIKWSNSLPDGTNAVGNFDSDPLAEIVLVSSGKVWLLDHTMSVIWGPVIIPGGGAGGPPTVADFDGDGDAEIGVAGAVRYAVFETDGSLKWAAVTQDASSNRTGSSVFDFEGDGSAEVVYSDEISLKIYRGSDGAVLFNTTLSSCTWHEYPIVADVDGDDQAELIAVANNNCGFGSQRGIYVYGDIDEEWVPTRPLWNQHTYHITNVLIDGTIPQDEDINWLVPHLNNFRLNEFGLNEGPKLFVTCDIYPNRVPNRVFLSRNYTLYVAVLGSAAFDVTGLNSSTVKFGKTGTEASPVRAPLLRDINGDGFLDAMYGFRTFDCGFALGDTNGVLTGNLNDGTDIEGSDSVLVSP